MLRQKSGKNGLFLILLAVFATTTAGLFGSFFLLKTPAADAVACFATDGGVNDDDSTVNGEVLINSAKSVAADVTVYDCTATNFRIGGSGVLTLQGNTGTGAIAQINFSNLTIDSGGILNANGQGCVGDNNEGNGPNASNVCINDGGLGSFAVEDGGGGGGGHGGYGGANSLNPASGGGVYGSATAPDKFGASGAGSGVGTNGGTGGGVIRIDVSGTLTHNGVIRANGADASGAGGRGAGGGAGGSIYVTAATFDGSTGTFQAKGGNGFNESSYDGGGGGGGRISVTRAGGAFSADSGDFDVSGGTNGGGSGGAGTVGTVHVVNTQGTGPTTDDAVSIFHGFTYEDVDFNVASWTTDSSATNQHCVTGISSLATPSVTANVISFAGTLNCTQSIASFTMSASGGAATLTFQNNASFSVNAAVTLAAGSGFSLGSPVTIGNSKTNADMTFTIPAGNNQTWTNVTIDVAPEGELLISAAIDMTLAGTTAVNGSVNWSSIGNMTVGSSASIAANGKGCVGDNNEGNGPNGSNACINDGGLGSFAVEDGGGGGGGHGGAGGANSLNSASGGGTFGSATATDKFGASGAGSGFGANGGNGGGLVRLNVTGTFTHNGVIRANGADASGAGGRGAGGGAGGSIYVTAATFDGTTGTFQAKGGNGFNDSAYDGGGGGGGRVAITRASGSFSVDSGDFDVSGGTNGGGTGGAGAKGTVYVRNTTTSRVDIFHGFTYADTDYSETTWVIDSSATNQYCDAGIAGSATPSVSASTLNVAGSFTCTQSITSFTYTTPNAAVLASSTVISVNGALAISGGTSFSLGSGSVLSVTKIDADMTLGVPVGNDQTWTNVTLNSAREGYVILANAFGLTLAGTTAVNANVQWTALTNLTIASTASINANAKGCVGDNNEGNGPNGSNACINDGGLGSFAVEDGGGGGGGHGGTGGANSLNPASGGGTYDSSTAPVLFGASGAGSGTGSNGGTGGGAIRLVVSGTFTNNGAVTASGGNGAVDSRGSGGGAGGSIYITTGTYTCASAPVYGVAGGAAGVGGGYQGGGGGGGRISFEYATDSCGSAPLSGLTASALAPGGASGGGGSTAGSTGTLNVTATNPAPVVTVVTHTPASPTQITPVTLSGTATDNAGVTRIDIFLDGTAPANLKHTCLFSPSQTPASCSVSVGAIAYGAHTTTIRAYDGASTTDGIENFTVSGNTLASGPQISRSKASATGVSFTLSFTLQGTSTGTLTVTFPVGFTVTQAPSGAGSSACLSSFGSTSSTMTATKTACSGTVVLAGGQVTNPATPGVYVISWTNDSGSGSVVITDDDQVTVSGQVDPQLTFNAGSQTAACDGTFSGFGGGLGLGTLTTGAVASSDVSSVPHVCTRVTANAGGGAVVSVRSANAALASVSTPSHVISSATATLVAGTAGYGMCVGSSVGDTGRDATTPAGATPSAAVPFSSSCTTSAHSVGALTASAQTLWSISGPSQNAFARIFVKAAISPTTNAHADYADTLTFTATGTY